MIKIVARKTVKADAIEKFQEAAQELVVKSRAEEGNLSYTLNQSTQDPCVHCFIEIWRDQEAFDAHKVSEHFTRIFPQLSEFIAETIPTDFYDEVTW